jgi:hypothetical protein
MDLLVSDIAPLVEELPNSDLALDPFFGGKAIDFVVCAFACADIANVQRLSGCGLHLLFSLL